MKRQLEAARRLLQAAGYTRRFARSIALECRNAGPMLYWLEVGHDARPSRPELAARLRGIFAETR